MGVSAARYLLDKGHRRIAFVQNSAAGDFSALERRDGYAATVQAAGLEPWVFVPSADKAPFEAGKQAMEALMNRNPPPDTIIFANDNLAAGGLLAGLRAGLRIPQDCAVVGFGDYPFGGYTKTTARNEVIENPSTKLNLMLIPASRSRRVSRACSSSNQRPAM